MNNRPTRHLHGPELVWFDFDPGAFVELATRHEDGGPDLAAQLAGCQRAAWQCDAYLAFRETTPGGVSRSVVLWQASGQDYVVDLDGDGKPIGIEFLARLPCRSG
jgi:hypothetical protein